MTSTATSIRTNFDDRAASQKVFEVFSGTQTPGQNGVPDINDPDAGLSISEASAIATLSGLGLTGVSYGLMQYSKSNPAKTVVDAMKPLYEKIQIGKALEAAQEGKSMTKLMELLPVVGVGVKRLNIDAIWKEVGDVLKVMQLHIDQGRLAIEPVDNSMDKFHDLSTKAFYGFGSLTALGTAVTTVTAAYVDRAIPFVDDAEKATETLEGPEAIFAEDAMKEVNYRIDGGFAQVDARVEEVEALVQDLPSFQGLVDTLAEAEGLLDPIKSLTATIKGLEGPFNSFLGVADVLGAPISGILDFFESPPKILPNGVEWGVIVEGHYGLLNIWIPPIYGPIPSFTHIFPPIPRSDVQKIIDVILNIAGIPFELMSIALSPILGPLENTIASTLKPIIDKLNPFKQYLDEFDSVADLLADLSSKLGDLVAEIEAAIGKIDAIDINIDTIDAIGVLNPEGMETYFGTDDAEVINGKVAKASGGYLDGAVLHGNGGDDTIKGTEIDDMLSGGSGQDVINGDAGNDLLLGGSDADILDGGAGDDVILGGSGDDTITGGLGNDTIDGGAGDDLQQFLAEDFADFTITRNGDEFEFSRAVGSGIETDTIKGIETFVFKDQTISLSELETSIAPSNDDPSPVEPVQTQRGGDGDDVITATGTRAAFMTGGGGADVFEFDESLTNGSKGLSVVEDFDLTEDRLRVPEDAAVQMLQTGGGVMLILSGDGDAVYLRDSALELQDMATVMDLV